MRVFFSFIVCLVGVLYLVGLCKVQPVYTTSTGPDVFEQLNAGSQAAGYGTNPQDPRIAVAHGVKIFLSILGIVLVALMVYAGFLIFTAAGNDEQIGKAKGIITTAIIGLVIILSAYSITTFVASRILAETIGN